MVLNNTNVEDNTATVLGGGMAMGFGVTTEVKGGSTVNTNTAVSGGGIYNSGDLKVTSSAIDGTMPRSRAAAFISAPRRHPTPPS